MRVNEQIDIIWGAKDIGREIGRSADYVRRTLAKMPNTPVHRDNTGRLYCFRTGLQDYFRRLAAKA